MILWFHFATFCRSHSKMLSYLYYNSPHHTLVGRATRPWRIGGAILRQECGARFFKMPFEAWHISEQNFQISWSVWQGFAKTVAISRHRFQSAGLAPVSDWMVKIRLSSTRARFFAHKRRPLFRGSTGKSPSFLHHFQQLKLDFETNRTTSRFQTFGTHFGSEKSGL
jgi:hypothetical protein